MTTDTCAFVARHISRFPQRDMEALLPWLCSHVCGTALTLDLDAVTEWPRIERYLTDEGVPRKCPHCASEFPHLRAWLEHRCALERCELPCLAVGCDLREHRKTCCWVAETCPWCHGSFARHAQHCCPHEPCTCDACGAALTRSTATQHAAACPEQQVCCPHEGCDVRIGQARLKHHTFQCPHRVLRCTWCDAQHAATEPHDCAQQPVTCTHCQVTMPRGAKGATLRRHTLLTHTVPDTVAQLRRGERAHDLAHAMAMRLQCPCKVCRSFELIARVHHERDGCAAACDHPLCPHQPVRCMWPGCTERHPLQHVAEHERLCPQRRAHCPVCREGPLDLESLRQHLFPQCAAVTAAQAPERAAEGRAHLAVCAAPAPCATCDVWRAAFFSLPKGSSVVAAAAAAPDVDPACSDRGSQFRCTPT